MTTTKLTNVLLSVIAILLLVLVVQNSSGRRSPHGSLDFPSDMAGRMPEHRPEADAPSMPGEAAGDPESAKGFHPAEMVIGSLSCPSDASLTLSDKGCTGKEADERRSLVESNMAKNLSISKIYDLVVEKFGEKALTESALQIRKGRRTATK
jgi:hypothetical protein